jgi:Domain of unknown function (DUF4476)
LNSKYDLTEKIFWDYFVARKLSASLKNNRNMKILKSLLLTALTAILALPVVAQVSNAIIFTENGERFTVILNGLRQNENPETNVRINGLNAEYYKLKIIFADAALGEKNFNMPIELGTETTFVIKRNSKNEYVLRPVSSVILSQAPPAPAGSTVVEYHESPAPAPAPTSVTQQTTTTTTTNGSAPGNGSFSMGVNISETGGGINMNVSGFEEEGTVTTTHHTTTVTTTTTTTGVPVQPAPAPVPAPAPPPPSYLPGYNGPIGCPNPMMANDFESMKNSIGTKTFEDSKLTIAKQILNSNCLLSSQVKEVMLLFTFEDTRLEFAKYAYGRTYDIGNYYKVNDAFTFETSIDDLNEYISSYRR